VNLTPYFKARVIKITEHYAALESLVTDDERIQEDFGTADIRVTGGEITVTLTPKIGALFEINGRKGRITQAEDTSFTVDFNHPLAGHTILLDMEVLTLTKASALRNIIIPWQEDHDTAFLAAGREEKPMVLVLYADWCQWSKRLLGEVFEDPRIKILRDWFVWAKVDSYKYSEYKDLYGQNGFPMVVFMNRQGKVVTKLDGFHDAKTVRQALDQLIHRDTPMLSSR
jgi:hypothetical protein